MQWVSNIWNTVVSSVFENHKTKLSTQMQKETRTLQSHVNKHPFVTKLCKKQISKEAYHQYLVDLQAIYKALEDGLKSCKHIPFVQEVNFEELFRSKSLKEDLKHFKSSQIHPSQAAKDYAQHLNWLTIADPMLLIGHAYVFYMNDLTRCLLVKGPVEGKWPKAIAYYDYQAAYDAYPKACNPQKLKKLFTDKLNKLSLKPQEKHALIAEAKMAYEYTEKMLDAIQPRDKKESSSKSAE